MIENKKYRIKKSIRRSKCCDPYFDHTGLHPAGMVCPLRFLK